MLLIQSKKIWYHFTWNFPGTPGELSTVKNLFFQDPTFTNIYKLYPVFNTWLDIQRYKVFQNGISLESLLFSLIKPMFNVSAIINFKSFGIKGKIIFVLTKKRQDVTLVNSCWLTLYKVWLRA